MSEAFLELPIALGYGLATGPTLKTALCHIRTLVGRRINNDTRSKARRPIKTGSGVSAKDGLYLSYAPPAYEYGTRPFLRWALSQGRSPTR